MFKCKHCEKTYSKHGIGTHIWRKHTKTGKKFDPNKGYVIGTRKIWNKGLTKNTDRRVKKITETQKDMFDKGLLKTTKYIPLSDIHKKKLSKVIKQKVKDGTWHNSFSKARTHKYKGISLYGTWELNYAKYLDSKNIEWKRPTSSFPYFYKNTQRQYTPDFYLPIEKTYIEIKGYETERDRMKWKYFPHKLRILKGEDLIKLNVIESYKNIPL